MSMLGSKPPTALAVGAVGAWQHPQRGIKTIWLPAPCLNGHLSLSSRHVLTLGQAFVPSQETGAHSSDENHHPTNLPRRQVVGMSPHTRVTLVTFHLAVGKPCAASVTRIQVSTVFSWKYSSERPSGVGTGTASDRTPNLSSAPAPLTLGSETGHGTVLLPQWTGFCHSQAGGSLFEPQFSHL